MSTPALKPRPSARSTTARVERSLPAPRMASARSNHPFTGRAFTGGWSTTTSTTPSSWRSVLITLLLLRVLRRDGDDLTGHVRRVVAGEEDDHVGDLPRLGGAAERLPRRQLLEELVRGDLREERVHGDARRHRVDADPEPRALDPGGAGQRVDAGLRGGVVGLADLGP